MTSRERILAALSHSEPDRVSVDLGATDVTGILAPAYVRLRRALGCADEPVRVHQPAEFLPLIEEPVLEFARADATMVGFMPSGWVASEILGDEPCLVPAEQVPEPAPGGAWVLRDPSGRVTAHLPQGGSSFRPLAHPLAEVKTLADLDRHAADIAALDAPTYAPEDYEDLAARARDLAAPGRAADRARVLYLGGHVFAGAQYLMGYERFMVTLALDPTLAEGLMGRIVEAQIGRIERYAEAVGDLVDVVYVADDLGTQEALQVSPETYRRRVKPHHARLYAAIRERFGASYLMLHTDGAVRPLIPDFIEMGVQVLNPVQVSAAGMDSAGLKHDFGRDIAFWGGGCDGQRVLPFGTPGEVADEVTRRLDDLAPGGGFVFSHIHNMQPETPAANIIALYDALRARG